jgi:predicted acyl esterase
VPGHAEVCIGPCHVWCDLLQYTCMNENQGQDIEELLHENLRLAEENNRLLHKLWRAEVTSFWSKILFYVILVGVPVFVYQYYLDGYVQQMRSTYDSLRTTAEQVKNLPPIESLPAAVIKQFGGSQE